MGLISSPRKRRVTGRQLVLPFADEERKRGGNRGKQCVADRQMSGCGAESRELDTCRPKVSIFLQSARHLASS